MLSFFSSKVSSFIWHIYFFLIYVFMAISHLLNFFCIISCILLSCFNFHFSGYLKNFLKFLLDPLVVKSVFHFRVFDVFQLSTLYFLVSYYCGWIYTWCDFNHLKFPWACTVVCHNIYPKIFHVYLEKTRSAVCCFWMSTM